ncbi:MAG: F0F1 ATP synthase subunit B [Elusimicrobiota bacterium]
MIEINGLLLLTHIVTFLIGMGILWKLAWGPITQMMRDREERIKKTIDDAAALHQKNDELNREYAKKIQEIQTTVSTAVANAEIEGTKLKDSILASAQADAKMLVEKTRTQLQQERNQMIIEVREDAAKVSLMIAEKLLKQTVDPKIQQKFFADFLSKVGKNTENTN